MKLLLWLFLIVHRRVFADSFEECVENDGKVVQKHVCLPKNYDNSKTPSNEQVEINGIFHLSGITNVDIYTKSVTYQFAFQRFWKDARYVCSM